MTTDFTTLNRQVGDMKGEIYRPQEGENEAVYRSLFENNHAVMLLIDPETAAIRDANPAACAYYGWSQEQLKALRIDEINTLTREEIFTQMQLALAEKRRNFFFKHRRADGSVRDVEIFSGPLTVRGQTLLYSIVHDITERKQAEDALRESKDRFRNLVESAPIGIFTTSSNGKALSINLAMARILDCSSQEEAIKRYTDLSSQLYVHAERRDEFLCLMRTSNRVEDFEYQARTATGRIIWLSMNARISEHGENGSFIIEGFATDITERKQSEEALRQSEERHRQIVESSTDAIIARAGEFIAYANPAAVKLFRASHAEGLVGKRYLDLVHPDDRAESIERIQKGWKEKWIAPPREHRIVALDGQVVDVESTGIPVQYRGETQLFGVFRDITERKKSEKKLQEWRQLMDFIIRHDPNAIAVYDENLRYIFVSERYLDDYKVKDRNIIGKHHYQVFPEMPERWKQVHQRVLAGAVERSEEDSFERLDGSVDYNRWECRPWYRPDGSIGGMITYTEVITERKRAEEALRESEEIFNAFMEHCPVYVFFKDENIRPIRLSQNYERMLGRPVEEVLGKAMDELFPADLAKGMIADDLAVIKGGRAIKVVEELNGRTFETTKFPIQQYGRPTMLAGFTIDITERKLADQHREKLEAQLRQAQKMEAIGTLAGGIAHDFNNILSIIIGNAEILEMSNISFSGNSELDQILSASKRAKQLVRQILAFSRQGEQQKLLMSLKPVVKETIEFLRSSIPSVIQIQHYIHHDVPAVIADPTQMQQVLMNLCTNAAHAMEKEGGVLKVELGPISVSEEDARNDPEVDRGEYVRLTVSDTGHGIEPTLIPRIFDPYFTTKGPEKGTGLGLSVVHGIIKSHGGIIKVYSEVGKGTVFHVLIPKADGVEAKAEEKRFRAVPLGKEKILVVDDEKHVVEMYQRMMGLLGYQVEARTSPLEAIEAVRANPRKYDLVLTDMTMPQMTGYALAKHLIEMQPDLPIILCTGFGDQINENKAQSVGILALLLKPVLFNDLANSLREVLDRNLNKTH
jgi:PAS domain S-box-containing protein